MEEYKITAADVAAHGVQSRPDKLTGTAAQNKQVFDELITAVVKDKHNGLVDALAAALAAKMAEPPAEGAPGQYLRTDGAGGRSWATPSGSGDMLKSVYDPTASGVVLAAQLSGQCSGAAARLAVPRALSVSDASGAHAGAPQSFDGSAPLTLPLPPVLAADLLGSVTGNVTGDVTGSCSGNAATADAWSTPRAFHVTDASGAHAGALVSVSGADAVTLPLPDALLARLLLPANRIVTTLPDASTLEEGEIIFKVVS